MDSKECPDCHKLKSLSAFYKKGAGLTSECKPCHKAKQNARREREREKLKLSNESPRCLYCSNEFQPTSCRLKYCSVVCYKNAHRIRIACGYCLKPIIIPQNAAKRKIYCSDECKQEARHVIPAARICRKCHTKKSSDEFIKVPRGDGSFRLESRCKECQKITSREIYYKDIDQSRAKMRKQHHKNKEVYYAKAKEWKAKNPEKVKRLKKEWDSRNVQQNPEYHREKYQKRFAGVSVEEKKAIIAQWRENGDKDNAKAHRQKRRAIERGTQVEHIRPSVVMERDGYICYLCGVNLRLTLELIHIEHLIPLSRGGTHTYDNVAVSCANCNQRKKAKLPGDCLWAKRRLALVLYGAL